MAAASASSLAGARLRSVILAWKIVARRRPRHLRRVHAVRRRLRQLLQPLLVQRADRAGGRRGDRPSRHDPDRANRLDRLRRRDLLLGGRGDPLRLRVRGQSAVPVGRGRVLPRLLPGLLRRDDDPRQAPALRVRPDGLDRRGDGGDRRGRARICRALRGRVPPHRRQHLGDRHQPRLSARRCPPPVRRCRRVRADRVEARPHLGADRSIPARRHDRRRDLPLPDGHGHLQRGNDPRRAVACVHAPARRGRLAAAAARGRSARRSAAPRHLSHLRRHRPGDPRLRPLPPAQPARGQPRVCDAGRGRRPARLHVPREHAHRRAVAHALRHRRPDRPRQPAPARRRTGERARRRRPGRAEAAGDLRPRRVQALQRHLRPPRRRCSAGEARGSARKGGRPVWGLLPAGRRRVLRSRGCPRRGRGGVPRGNGRGPVRVGRGLRGDELIRRRPSSTGGLDVDRGPARGRPAPLRAEARALGPAGAARDAAPGALRALPRAAGTRRGGRPYGRRDRRDVRAVPGRARRAAPRGPPPRRGQAGRPRRRPPEARPAPPGGVGVHQGAHGDRPADPRRRPGLARRRRDRAGHARALGRDGLPGRARRRRDPARGPHHRSLRRLLRHDVAAPIPPADRA